MTRVLDQIDIERDAPLPTWFHVGGGADRLAHPRTSDDLLACLELDRDLVVLGDGANLLVDDDGTDRLVVTLDRGSFAHIEGIEQDGDEVVIRAGAGANLPKAIVQSVRYGLEGIEGLGGIPATIGGAVRMNAGGAFGQIADVVRSVEVISRDGEVRTLPRDAIDFGYRRSGLEDCLITSVELSLRRAESQTRLRAQQLAVMAYKKRTQPMAEKSAGCCFKNPTLACDVEALGEAGDRVSAGFAIDRAGGKGARVGGAIVSERHANFITTEPGASARDVILLMEHVEQLVRDRFGIELEREVVVWRRSGGGAGIEVGS